MSQTYSNPCGLICRPVFGNGNVKKAVSLMSKTTTLHVHHAFCTFLCRPCTTTTWHDILSWLENGNRKAINFTFSIWNRTRSPLFSSNRTPPLSSNWVTWYKGEKFVKDAKSIFQLRFHWRRRCRIIRCLMLGELRSAEWEVVGSNPARTNNQGL